MGAPSIMHSSLPSKDRKLVPKRLRIPAKLEAVLDDHGSGNADVVLLQRRCPAPVRPACRLDSENGAFK